MTETPSPDEWLIASNKTWHDLHDRQRDRADRATVGLERARRAATFWRRMTVAAWGSLLIAFGQWLWRWPHWTIFAIVVATGLVNSTVDYREAKRRKRAGDA